MFNLHSLTFLQDCTERLKSLTFAGNAEVPAITSRLDKDQMVLHGGGGGLT